MRFIGLFTFLLFMASVQAQETDGAPKDVLAPYQDAAIKKWEKEIVKIEQRDKETEDPADAVLFIGSSSIRRWDTITKDMAPYHPIQRGYGGAKYSDLAVFAQRLIHPHQYRAMVVFVGNDVSGKESDHTPDQVEQLVRYVINVSRKHQPNAPIVIIEVTPTGKRFDAWGKIRALNARLREVALTSDDTYFLATAEYYLDPKGIPRDELFVEDRLHLNAEGYRIWSKLIRDRLDHVLRQKLQMAEQATSEAN